VARRVLEVALVMTVTCGGAVLAPAAAAELVARGPESCPDATELVFRLERAVGKPLLQSAPLRFSVVFSPPGESGARYTARLEVQGEGVPSSHRVLNAHDCARLGDAVSVAIALAIGSTEAAASPSELTSQSGLAFESASGADARSSARSDARSAPASLAPAVGGAPRTSVEPIADDSGGSPAPREAAPASLSPLLGLALVMDSGSLPAPGLGLGVGVELRSEHFGVRVGGTVLFDQNVALDGTGAAGATMSLWLGSLSACGVPFGSYRAALAGFVCAGWELGRLAAEGTGVSAPRSGDQIWSAPRVDAGLSVALFDTAFRLDLLASALVPLERDEFYLRDVGSVHRVPGAVGRLALGVNVDFE
jgi:hypothetical protein